MMHFAVMTMLRLMPKHMHNLRRHFAREEAMELQCQPGGRAGDIKVFCHRRTGEMARRCFLSSSPPLVKRHQKENQSLGMTKSACGSNGFSLCTWAVGGRQSWQLVSPAPVSRSPSERTGRLRSNLDSERAQREPRDELGNSLRRAVSVGKCCFFPGRCNAGEKRPPPCLSLLPGEVR